MTGMRQLPLTVWQRAGERQVGVLGLRSTVYVNRSPCDVPAFPDDEQVEHRIRACIRWNSSREENDLARRGG